MRMDYPSKNVWRNHQRPKPSNGLPTWVLLVLQTERKTDDGWNAVGNNKFIFSSIFRLCRWWYPKPPAHIWSLALAEHSVILILTRIDCLDLLQAALMDISGCFVGDIAQVKT